MKKSAFVTGADRGVGLALVKGLLNQSYQVFAGQYAEEVPQLAELKDAYGERLQVLRLDISSDDSVAEAWRIASKQTEQLDLLINNGAILGDIGASVLDPLNYTEMMDVFNVNTLGSLRMSQTFMPLLLKSDSKLLVNISSEAGSIGDCYRESWYAYCMSKAALNMQSKLIHNGIKPHGGRVLVVHPGWVQTYMQGKLDAGATLTPEQSAASILQLVAARLSEDAAEADCEYVDYAGNALNW
ncbi:SDR family NAD(P)-dependent oxidoreductase [Paenibacillus sp. PL91]|uniref:SDR family NAD(P)-dependent oxidoreductase n=1 Tax=Paenibacillus sp. PL91 TaxID=2729538 RepID=UPI00145F0D05|nr:SDR family NAD(P)-dependent oxidoreductase [Paenibacillus sp. PL91]MBC9202452.1 SDR family NAD(P)-dependent oxidoreductase [Paenibacillus sp. PL91]